MAKPVAMLPIAMMPKLVAILQKKAAADSV
jgi:hypothetical protein